MRVSAIITTGAAVSALTVALCAAPSSAITAATWTVKPGGSTTASGTADMKDTNTGQVSPCKKVKLDVTLKTGSGLTSAGIGSISSASFTGCDLDGVFDPLSVAVGGLPWKLNATSYDAKTGVTTGTITGVDLVFTGPGCSATLDGTAADADNGKLKVTYTNSTGKLKFVPKGGYLHWWAVSGCFGLVTTGDAVQPSGTLTVAPEQTITSP